MFELKPLSQAGIPAALERAQRYRLLNEPSQAESICRDVLQVDSDSQDALILLLLALTDQFAQGRDGLVADARALLPRLDGEYERAYYAGIICERRAWALLERATAGTGPVAYDWFRQAMELFEKAERLRPAGNDDALLRWNTCARAIMNHAHVRPASEEGGAMLLE